MPKRTRAVFAVCLGIGVFALDQILKDVLFFSSPATPTSGRFVQLVQHYNYGISFNLPLPMGWIIAVTLVFLVGLGVYTYREQEKLHPLMLVGIACLAGGACGNLIDRVTFGYVRDWLLLGRSAVNLADGAILLGFIGFFINQHRLSTIDKRG